MSEIKQSYLEHPFWVIGCNKHLHICSNKPKFCVKMKCYWNVKQRLQICWQFFLPSSVLCICMMCRIDTLSQTYPPGKLGSISSLVLKVVSFYKAYYKYSKDVLTIFIPFILNWFGLSAKAVPNGLCWSCCSLVVSQMVQKVTTEYNQTIQQIFPVLIEWNHSCVEWSNKTYHYLLASDFVDYCT